MAQTYLLESPPPKNSRTKPSPFVFGDFGAVPELFSGTVQRGWLCGEETVRDI